MHVVWAVNEKTNSYRLKSNANIHLDSYKYKNAILGWMCHWMPSYVDTMYVHVAELRLIRIIISKHKSKKANITIQFPLLFKIGKTGKNI